MKDYVVELSRVALRRDLRDSMVNEAEQFLQARTELVEVFLVSGSILG